jgi:amino-acid N-acetyltransferase
VLWWRRVLLMRIDRATASDVPAVEALLREAGALALGVVAREGLDVVAAAAVERYRDAGLLRSVVVAPERRGTGLGRDVVAAAEALAAADGVRDLYLVTETAIDWFPRLGYEVVEREVASAAVGESIELTTVCRDTGVTMRRRLS